MRLRNKTWAKPLIEAHPEMILVRPEKMPGQCRHDLIRSSHYILKSALAKGSLLLPWLKPIRNIISSLWNCRRRPLHDSKEAGGVKTA